MKRSHYTITPFWDKKAIKPDGTSRIMITVNLHRQQFRITVKLYSTKADFDKATKGRSGSVELKKLRNDINSCILKAEAILERMPNISKDTFLKFFKSEVDLTNSDKTEVYPFFKDKRTALLKENRFGSASTTKDAMYSLQSFKPTLYFEDIDSVLIKSYHSHMKEKGRSDTTVGMYLRSLRTIYNQTIEAGIIPPPKKNPFKELSLRSSAKSKDVLYPDQLKVLWEYQPIGIREDRAKDFFFFSYLCNGMNFKDIGHLKFMNIKGNVLSFQRMKTRNTKKNQKEIRIYIHDEVRRIIDKWGTKTKRPEDHIFPQFNKLKDQKHLNNTILRYKSGANKMLNKIGIKLGFDVRLNIAIARHSFATKQKLSGTPVSFISDAMGHSSVAVTEHYLKSLPDENLKVMSDKLLSF